MIFVINPGSTSTKIALFIDEKPVWVAGPIILRMTCRSFTTSTNSMRTVRDFVLRLLAEADIPLDFDAVIARGGLLEAYARRGVCH